MKHALFVAPFVVLAGLALWFALPRNEPEPPDITRRFCNEFPPLYANGKLVETYSPTALVQAIRRLMGDTVTAGQREGQQMAEQLETEAPAVLGSDIHIYGSMLGTISPPPAKGEPETDPALTSDYVQLSMRNISRWLVDNCPVRDGWPSLKSVVSRRTPFVLPPNVFRRE